MQKEADNNQEIRVFCEVDELKEAENIYQSFLEQQQRRKRGELIKDEKQEKVKEYDNLIQRKEAFVEILNLKAAHELEALQKLC